MAADSPPGLRRQLGESPPRFSSSALVGRATELDALVVATTLPPALALVQGEAGVGKTRLVAAALDELHPGHRRLVGCSHPMRERFTLGPVLEALRQVGDDGGVAPTRLSPLVGVLRPLLPEIGHLLPSPPDAIGDAIDERHRIWRALRELLCSLGPTVLVLEDLHWADESTGEFLRFLVAEPPGELTLVVTYRPDEVDPSSPLVGLATRLPSDLSLTRLDLEPLGPDDVRSLIGSILGTDEVSEELAAYLHERTAGLPFAVEEVLRLLQDRRDIVKLEGHWARRALERLQVPAAIRDSMLERLAMLGTDARRVVDAAAVMAFPATLDVLGGVAGLAPVRARTALSKATEVGLLQEGPAAQYGFRHALAAQAAYAAIGGSERQRLHLRAAHAIDAAGDAASVARLAHHWKHAGRAKSWARCAEEAATITAARGDHAGAAWALHDALSAPGLGRATQARLGARLGHEASIGLVDRRVVTTLRGLVDDGVFPARVRGRVRCHLAALLHQLGDASGSRAELVAATADLRRDPAGLAYVTNALASPWVLDGHLDDHLAWLDKASAIAAGDPVASERLRADRAMVLVATGDPAGWAEVPERPPPRAPREEKHEWVRICTNLATSAFYLGHHGRARAFVAEGLGASADLDYPRLMGALHTTELLLDWTGGRWTGLEATARRLASSAEDIPAAVQAKLVLGSLRLAAGEVDEAEPILVEATAGARSCGAVPVFAMAAGGLARIEAHRGSGARALTDAIEALAAVDAKGIAAWSAYAAPAAVQALVTGGRSVEAAAWVEKLAGGLAERDAPFAAASLALCRGMVGDDAGDAAASFAGAEAAFAELPAPYWVAEAKARRGDAVMAVDRTVGTDHLLEALSRMEALGATFDGNRIRRDLRRHGVVVPQPWKGGTKGYGAELSPREQDVVDLAAAGLTNVEIGGRLFLSPKTVGHHLERAMAKLGVASRRQLPAARARRG